MNCPATTRNEYPAQCKGEEPKPKPSVNIPPRSKEQEIENLKRLLAHISQRLDVLKTR